MTPANKTLCWICGEEATTGEHLVRRSDLKRLFGKPKPGKLLRLHNDQEHNVPIQGLRSQRLMLPKSLCAKCNNERTQPYDFAWEKMSAVIAERLPTCNSGSAIRASRIFETGSNEQLRYVQLYFTKLFGCLIHEGAVPIKLDTFAACLLSKTYHPSIFLRFGLIPKEHQIVGVTGLDTQSDTESGEVIGANFFYNIGQFAVQVIYVPNAHTWIDSEGAWHPKHGTGKITLQDFELHMRPLQSAH